MLKNIRIHIKTRGLRGAFGSRLIFLCFICACASCTHLRGNKDIAEFASVPQDALWVLRFDNLKALHEFCQQESAVGRVLSVADSSWLVREADLEHWMREVPYLSNLAEGSFSVSAHAIGKQACLLFSFPQPQEDPGLLTQLEEKGFKVNKMEQSEGLIYQITTPSSEIMFATHVSKRLIFSKSRILIESSLHQVKAGYSLASSHDFAYAYKQADMSQPVSVWINMEQLGSTIQPLYAFPAVSWIQKMQQVGKWMVLDLEHADHNFLFEGILTYSPAEMSISQVWLKKEEIRLPVWDVLPANVKQAWVESVQNSEGLIGQMLQYRDKQSKAATRLPQHTQQLIAPREISALVKDWDPQSLSLANAVMGDGVDVWMGLMRCSHIENYRKSIMEALGKYNNLNQLADMHLSHLYPIDTTGATIRVYVNPYKGLYPYLYGEMYTLISDAYIGFYGDYALIGPTPVAIVEWVQSIRAHRTLSEVGYMQTLRDEAETKALAFYFLRPDVQRTPWINGLQTEIRKKMAAADFDRSWGGMWMRMQKEDEYIRVDGQFLGRSAGADTLRFSNPVGQPLMK